MSGDHRDRLIDVLLAEALGGEPPPDLAERILSRMPDPERAARRRLRWLVPTAAGIAAAIVAALCLVPMATYPPPRAGGSFAVIEGGEVARGRTLTTPDGPATLALGDYVRMQIAPLSAVRLEGQRNREQVDLWHGEVTCEVDRSKGEFAVRTEVGTVRTTGTTFRVRILEPQKGDQAMGKQIKQMMVTVLAGAVLASGAWGETPVDEGQTKVLPPSESDAVPLSDLMHGGSASGVVITAQGKGATVRLGSRSTTEEQGLEELKAVCELTDRQVADIRKLIDERDAAMAAWRPDYEAAVAKVREMIAARDNYDKGAVRNVYGPVQELQKQATRIRSEHQAKVDAILTEEQKAKWEGHKLWQGFVGRHFRGVDFSEKQLAEAKAMCAEAAKDMRVEGEGARSHHEIRKELVEDIRNVVLTPAQRDAIEQREDERRKRMEEARQRGLGGAKGK